MSDFNGLIHPICAGCKGKCCRKPIVSRAEIARLRSLGFRNCFFEQDGLRFIRSDPRCAFLSEHGCLIPTEERPIECRFFPLYFVQENGRLETRVHSVYRCPAVHIIAGNREWRKRSAALIESVIAEWSSEEIAAYSHHHRRSRILLKNLRLAVIRNIKGVLNLFLRGTCDRFANPFTRSSRAKSLNARKPG